MGVLQGFERRLEGAVEGFFARAFKSGLQPIELAKAVQRYIRDHQHVTSDGIVVPNVFLLQVSSKDHERLSTFGASLPKELGQVIVDTAGERGWNLKGPVKVRIAADERIRVGRYRMQGRIEEVGAAAPSTASSSKSRQSRPNAGSEPAADGSASSASSTPADPVAAGASSGLAAQSLASAAAVGAVAAGASTGTESADDFDRTQIVTTSRPATLQLVVRQGAKPGLRVPVHGKRLSVGRQSSADLTLEDSTVSREHAALVRRGESWWVIDLGSTNGTRVNGTAAAEQPVAPGDVIEFGGVTVEFVEA